MDYWENMETELYTALNADKRILVITRKPNEIDKKKSQDSLKDFDKIKEFAKKHKLDLVLTENLHAKIYLNERRVLITSMNLHKYSANNNIEIGCLIPDPIVAKSVANDIISRSLLREDKYDYVAGKYWDKIKEKKFTDDDQVSPEDELEETVEDIVPENVLSPQNTPKGFCIDCGKETDIDLSNPRMYPFCRDCLKKWKVPGDDDWHKQNYCHVCKDTFLASSDNVSYKHPLCDHCAECFGLKHENEL
jgi:hypothetical protein